MLKSSHSSYFISISSQTLILIFNYFWLPPSFRSLYLYFGLNCLCYLVVTIYSHFDLFLGYLCFLSLSSALLNLIFLMENLLCFLLVLLMFHVGFCLWGSLKRSLKTVGKVVSELIEGWNWFSVFVTKFISVAAYSLHFNYQINKSPACPWLMPLLNPLLHLNKETQFFVNTYPQ